jgi:hypothetical protein
MVLLWPVLSKAEGADSEGGQSTPEVKTPLPSRVENVMGVWEITIDFEGRKSYAMLTISKKEDGTLAGKWGRDELDDVKFQDGKLTFSRTVGPEDRQFTTNYEATLKDDKLMLTMSNDWGELSGVGARPKPMCPVLGHWDINFTVGDRDISARLIVTQKPDGTLEGKWNEEMGEHVISNVKFQDGKLTFTRNSKVNDFEFETTYEGVVKGDELIGMLKGGEMGQWQANGKRFGIALIGEWELTVTSDWGTRPGMMRILGDLTGRYEFFGGEIPMKGLKLEGNQVTFYIEFGPSDQTFKMEFKGKLDGKTLKGQMESDRGTSEIVGKKLEKPVLSKVEGKVEEKKAKPATK